MSRRATRILRDRKGTSAVEMALALPVLVTFIYGIFIFGLLFEANAGMQHALGEGARRGNLCLGATGGACTLPTKTSLSDLVNNKLFGTSNGTFGTPNVDTSTANSGYVTITVTYSQALNFLFFTGPSVSLTRSKKVYLADTPPTKTVCDAATAAHASDPTQAAAPASCSIYS